MTSSLLVSQVATLRERHPEAPFVVFVPRAQLGQAFETALARRLEGWRGIRALIPRHYAEEVARIEIFRSGRRQAPVEGRLFRAARLLKGQQAESSQVEGQQDAPGGEGQDLPGWHLLASTVADAIERLRTGGVGIDALRSRAQSAESSSTLEVVAGTYDRYLGDISQEDLYDDGDIFRWATERVRSGQAPGAEDTVYAVAGTVDLPERAYRFLEALRDRGHQFYRVGAGTEEPLTAAAPRESAAARFSDIDIAEPGAAPLSGSPRGKGPHGEENPTGSGEESPTDSGKATVGRDAPGRESETGEMHPGRTTHKAPEPTPERRFIRAVGAGEEVRSVFRDILRRGLAFEEVEIAYASERPYASLIMDTASALAMEEDLKLPPLTMGTGVPAGQTRTGQALRRFCEWAQEGFDPAQLVGMLRGRLIRTDRWLGHLEKERFQDGHFQKERPRSERPQTEQSQTEQPRTEQTDRKRPSGEDAPLSWVDEDLKRRLVGATADDLPPSRVATMVASRSYESGREGFIGGLLSAVRSKREDLRRPSTGALGEEAPPEEAASEEAASRQVAGKEATLEEAALERAKPGEATAKEELPDWAKDRVARWVLLCALGKDLVDLVPKKGTIQEVARGARTFLEVFGPVDRTDKPEEERTVEEAARNLLYDRIDRLAGLSVSCRGTAAEMMALFRRWLGQQVVAAQRPRPGHVHALPLESAGYSGRRHLYVVGLDSSTFSAPAPENGMLSESDRQALALPTAGSPTEGSPAEGSLGEGSPAEGSPANAPPANGEAGATSPTDDQLWRAVQALGRHRGPATYCTRTFAVEDGEERDPSSLFLRLEREARASGPSTDDSATEESTAGRPSADEPVEDGPVEDETSLTAGLVPDLGLGGERPPLSLFGGDLWLAARRQAATEAPLGEESSGDGSGETASARDRIGEVYPWILQGEAARQARASGSYTEHDGLLAPGSYPELRITDAKGEDPSPENPLSASRLETFAETPYIYFLKYVLGARPLEEPALSEEPWLNALRKGSLLHEIYERYMRDCQKRGASPSLEDRDRMREIVAGVLDEEAEEFAPPSGFVKAAARRELEDNALIFLHAEAGRSESHEPVAFELGFGYPPHRRQEGDIPHPAKLSVGGDKLVLRGRIDRVDRNPATSGLVLWDYKTGGASSYDDENPLQEGKTLQWSLYAQAIEALTGQAVEKSGYFFANLKEFGGRIAFPPGDYRDETKAILRRLAELAETGSFPVSKDLARIDRWKWEDYSRIFQDLRGRKSELRGKDYPEGRPEPPGF